ncbi:hypothetical protein CHCC15381_0404 [Bacillus paralicheniformis]|uniref:Uncharacterized protein n=1 Tax=Bacillus paralicheniformis TaxID=1648923 RepID=A0ABY3FXY9_9BACI|nr:hypothetical protein CHCC15381_0404 [Bacillus paralicheniformis]
MNTKYNDMHKQRRHRPEKRKGAGEVRAEKAVPDASSFLAKF